MDFTLNTIEKFEKISKYPLKGFMLFHDYFISEEYPQITAFYSGKSNRLNSGIIKNLVGIIKESKKIQESFIMHKKSFTTVDFWGLLDYITDMYVSLLSILNSSKWLRSSRVNNKFSGAINFQHTLKNKQTLEDVVVDILSDSNFENDWLDIVISNDLQEKDWDIDGGKILQLSKSDVFQSNLVTTVVDNLIGEKIYGKDIDKHLQFEDDDLKVLSYQDTLKQTVNIYATLKRGDIPEFRILGVNNKLTVGGTIGQLFSDTIIQQFKATFLSDDLFDIVEVSKFEVVNDSVDIEYTVKTKYDKILNKTK